MPSRSRSILSVEIISLYKHLSIHSGNPFCPHWAYTCVWIMVVINFIYLTTAISIRKKEPETHQCLCEINAISFDKEWRSKQHTAGTVYITTYALPIRTETQNLRSLKWSKIEKPKQNQFEHILYSVSHFTRWNDFISLLAYSLYFAFVFFF